MSVSTRLRAAGLALAASAGIVLAGADMPDGPKSFRQGAAKDKDLRPCIPDCPTGARFHTFDPNHPPPAGAKTFRLSQDYPEFYNPAERFAWETIDYAAEPEKYLRAVLAYCLDGNKDVDFR